MVVVERTSHGYFGGQPRHLWRKAYDGASELTPERYRASGILIDLIVMWDAVTAAEFLVNPGHVSLSQALMEVSTPLLLALQPTAIDKSYTVIIDLMVNEFERRELDAIVMGAWQ